MGLTHYCFNLPWELITVFLVLFVLDTISGVVKACSKSEFSSSEMRIKLITKVYTIILMLAILLINRVVILSNIGINLPLPEIVIGIFSFREFMSICENSTEMGLKLPKFVTNALKIAQEKFENEEKSE